MSNLIKINKVKKHFNDKGIKMSKEFQSTIDEEFLKWLNKICSRTIKNKRTTVLSRDL